MHQNPSKHLISIHLHLLPPLFVFSLPPVFISLVFILPHVFAYPTPCESTLFPYHVITQPVYFIFIITIFRALVVFHIILFFIVIFIIKSVAIVPNELTMLTFLIFLVYRVQLVSLYPLLLLLSFQIIIICGFVVQLDSIYQNTISFEKVHQQPNHVDRCFGHERTSLQELSP